MMGQKTVKNLKIEDDSSNYSDFFLLSILIFQSCGFFNFILEIFSS